MARQDWVSGYIGLEAYRKQVLLGMLITYAAHATPEFHGQIYKKIEELNSD